MCFVFWTFPAWLNINGVDWVLCWRKVFLDPSRCVEFRLTPQQPLVVFNSSGNSSDICNYLTPLFPCWTGSVGTTSKNFDTRLHIVLIRKYTDLYSLSPLARVQWGPPHNTTAINYSRFDYVIPFIQLQAHLNSTLLWHCQL